MCGDGPRDVGGGVRSCISPLSNTSEDSSEHNSIRREVFNSAKYKDCVVVACGCGITALRA